MDKPNRPIKKPSCVIGAYRQWHYELGLSHLETRIILDASKGYERGARGLKYTSQNKLADEYSVTEQGVRRAIKRLKYLQLIVVSRGLVSLSAKTIKLSDLKIKRKK